MTETLLRQLVESRWRWWSVIIVTLALGLLATLPAADEYFALSERRTRLWEELVDAEATAGDLQQLQEQLGAKKAALAALEARTVSSERMHLFRGKVVELARAAGCQVRRMSVGDPRRRDWRPGDNPLENAPITGPKPPSGYALKVQPVSMAVSGKLNGARDFLTRLSSMEHLIHVGQFTLQPADGEGREVTLEVDAQLFDLVAAERPEALPQK